MSPHILTCWSKFHKFQVCMLLGLVVVLAETEERDHNMVYFYQSHSTDWPSQSKRGESDHSVICSHLYYYCRRCLMKANIYCYNQHVISHLLALAYWTQQFIAHFQLFTSSIYPFILKFTLIKRIMSSPHCPSVLLLKREKGTSTLNKSPLNVTTASIAGILRRSWIAVLVMMRSSLE